MAIASLSATANYPSPLPLIAMTSAHKVLTPQERRAACNPLLIAGCVALIAPFLGFIWSYRQRSINLTMAILLPVIVWAAAPGMTLRDDERAVSKICFQIIAGLLAGTVANNEKKKAIDELNRS